MGKEHSLMLLVRQARIEVLLTLNQASLKSRTYGASYRYAAECLSGEWCLCLVLDAQLGNYSTREIPSKCYSHLRRGCRSLDESR